jgi:hypothetical protein
MGLLPNGERRKQISAKAREEKVVVGDDGWSE